MRPPTTNRAKQTGRARVMIVDPEWEFGLKLADCLATGGYHAVLVRNLESMIDEIGEIQPDAILLSPDPREASHGKQEVETLRIVNTLCPQTHVLTLAEPKQEIQAGSVPKQLHSPAQHRVEELVRVKLGIPFARIQ